MGPQDGGPGPRQDLPIRQDTRSHRCRPSAGAAPARSPLQGRREKSSRLRIRRQIRTPSIGSAHRISSRNKAYIDAPLLRLARQTRSHRQTNRPMAIPRCNRGKQESLGRASHYRLPKQQTSSVHRFSAIKQSHGGGPTSDTETD